MVGEPKCAALSTSYAVMYAESVILISGLATKGMFGMNMRSHFTLSHFHTSLTKSEAHHTLVETVICHSVFYKTTLTLVCTHTFTL